MEPLCDHIAHAQLNGRALHLTQATGPKLACEGSFQYSSGNLVGMVPKDSACSKYSAQSTNDTSISSPLGHVSWPKQSAYPVTSSMAPPPALNPLDSSQALVRGITAASELPIRTDRPWWPGLLRQRPLALDVPTSVPRLFLQVAATYDIPRHITLPNLPVPLRDGAKINTLKEVWVQNSKLATVLVQLMHACIKQSAGGSSSRSRPRSCRGKNSGRVQKSGKKSGQQSKTRKFCNGKGHRGGQEEEEEDSDFNSRQRSIDDYDDDDGEIYPCPYYLKDKIRHQACWNARWRGKDLRRIKEHLKRKHLCRWVCPECKQGFKDEESGIGHTHTGKRQRDYLDGFDYRQNEDLTNKGNIWGVTRHQYWNKVCTILFPSSEPLPTSREMQDVVGSAAQFWREVQEWHQKVDYDWFFLQHELSSLKHIIERYRPLISTTTSVIVPPPAEPVLMDAAGLLQGQGEVMGDDAVTNPVQDDNGIDWLQAPETQDQTLQPHDGLGVSARGQSQRLVNEFSTDDIPAHPSQEAISEVTNQAPTTSSATFLSSLFSSSQNHGQEDSSSV